MGGVLIKCTLNNEFFTKNFQLSLANIFDQQVLFNVVEVELDSINKELGLLLNAVKQKLGKHGDPLAVLMGLKVHIVR